MQNMISSLKLQLCELPISSFQFLGCLQILLHYTCQFQWSFISLCLLYNQCSQAHFISPLNSWLTLKLHYKCLCFVPCYSFFFFFINLSICCIHFQCYSLSRFPGKHPPPPSPTLWVLPSPSSPHCRPPPNNLVHWEFSLSRTQGFPFHWCSY